LEISCGLALPSLYLSRHVEKVVATDIASMGPVVVRGAQLNNCQNLRFEPLLWGDLAALQSLFDSEPKINLVLLCDVFYDNRSNYHIQ
jgi:predicted nicotinamide N-methyase